MDELFIEEAGTYFRQGRLGQLETQLLPQCREDQFQKNTIYSLGLFQEHLKYVTQVPYLDDLTSCVARCVEYGFREQLVLLLTNLDRLVKMSTDQVSLDTRLLLRRIDLPCYLIAKEAGFSDPELEKRISLFQKRWRGQQVELSSKFLGPPPEEYLGPDLEGSRYWGYRQMLYYLRWNRLQRYRMLKLIKERWWGDCRYQAYVDSLEPQTEDLLRWNI